MEHKVPIIITHEGAPRKSNNKLLEPGSDMFLTGRARKSIIKISISSKLIHELGHKVCHGCWTVKPIKDFDKDICNKCAENLSLKVCIKCKDPKPLGDFNKNRSRKDGLNVWCRICENSYIKKYMTEYRKK